MLDVSDRRHFLKTVAVSGVATWAQASLAANAVTTVSEALARPPADTASQVETATEDDGPLLYFSRKNIPLLKQKLKSPEYAAMWSFLTDQANQYCDPSSKNYADPAVYKNATTGDYWVARKLSAQLDTLGFVFQLTGNEQYGHHAASLLEMAARAIPVDGPTTVPPFLGAYGDMMRAAATGLDLLSGAFTEHQHELVVSWATKYLLQVIEEYQRPGGRWSAPHNFSGVCGGALGMLTLALRKDHPREQAQWLTLAEQMILEWFARGFDAKGSYFEGVMYMQYGLGGALLFADALRRHQGRSAVMESGLLRRLPVYMAMEMLPGESTFDARNDSLYTLDLSGSNGTASPYLLLLASGFHGAITPNPLAGWVWNNSGEHKGNFPLQITWGAEAGTTANGAAPVGKLKGSYDLHFEQQGLCIWRTGWNKDDTMFSIEAGPYHPVTHNQADKGHFNLYGLGYKWAVDCGYGNNQEPNGRCQTVAHSCVLVDGKGQALSGAALGTDGKILAYESNATYGYASVDSKSAYNHNNRGMLGVPLTKALRHVFFVKPSGQIPAYAIVLDDIEWGDHPHEYLWQMITWNEMEITTEGDATFVVKPTDTKDGPRMKVIVSASGPAKLSHDQYLPDSHPGRPPYNYKRLRAGIKTRNPYFAAVLAPLPVGAPEPQLTVKDMDGGRIVTVSWGNKRHAIEWKGDEAKWLI